jgi:hypothetical protein
VSAAARLKITAEADRARLAEKRRIDARGCGLSLPRDVERADIYPMTP